MKRTTAPNSASGLYQDRIVGVQSGTTLVAEDRNNIQEELSHAIELADIDLDGTDQYQLEKAIISLGTPLGFDIFSSVEQTPVPYAAARSSTNPSYPRYLPIISRAADADITTSQAPLLVPFMRDKKLKIMGTTDFTATVSGSVLTFASTTANDAFLKAISEDALVQRWFSSGQSANYAGSGADFSNGRCINVAGSDFAITAINVGSRTITVSGSPTTGSQTVILYPARIAGSTTSIRLHRLTGFVPVGAGDADGQYGGMMRVMDRGQGHYHGLSSSATALLGTPAGAAANVANSGAAYNQGITITSPTTDGTNGTPRTGKTTDPRAYGVYIYTWASSLLA